VFDAELIRLLLEKPEAWLALLALAIIAQSWRDGRKAVDPVVAAGQCVTAVESLRGDVLVQLRDMSERLDRMHDRDDATQRIVQGQNALLTGVAIDVGVLVRERGAT